jgi:Flp pilus assembly protein TadG
MSAAGQRRRRGTTTVEFAVTCPIAFLLIFGIVIGGLGIFRYQQTAALAREGARWASVHGGQYAEDTNQPAATAADVYSNAISPRAAGLNLNNLSYTVTWNQNNWPLRVDEDAGRPVGNTVTVTVAYQWVPELFLIGPFTLTSSSTAQMMY